MDNFFMHWFCGFQNSLSQIDPHSRAVLLNECAIACSDSYTKQIYINAKESSDNEEEFTDALRKSFPELIIGASEKGRKYHVKYSFCACDLVKRGYVNSPALCECSRQSLLYNWGSVFGENNVKVNMLETILSGAPCCRFEISVSGNSVWPSK